MLAWSGLNVVLSKCYWERKKCTANMAENRMELFIETLTGAAFELKVSPLETIVSIKAKIQYLEGIPVSQQHLIWRSQELLDDYCLKDYCITDGATLKLVLGMRGGPINTRQVPSEKKFNLAEYVEKRSETAASGGRPLTVLVFHDGDRVHMYTLLERGECSVTPLSGSVRDEILSKISGDVVKGGKDFQKWKFDRAKVSLETSSVTSTKHDDEEDAQWQRENVQTKEKMIKLQEQMKALSLSKPKRKMKSPSSNVAALHLGKNACDANDEHGEQLKLPPVQRSCTAQGTGKSQRHAIRLNSESVEPETIEKSVFSRWVAVTGSTAVMSNEETNKWESQHEPNVESYLENDNSTQNNTSASSSPKLKLNSIASPLLTLPEEIRMASDDDLLPSAPNSDKMSTPDGVLEKDSSFLPYLKPEQLQSSQSVDKKRFFNFSAQNASMIALGINSVNSPYKIVKYGPSKHKDPYRHLSVTSNQALATQRFLDLDHWIDNRPKTTPQGNLYRPLDSIVEGGVWGSIGSVHGHRPKKKVKSKHHLSVNLPSGNKLSPLSRLPENSDVRWNSRPSSGTLKTRTDLSRNPTKMGIGSLVASGARVLKSSSKASETSETMDSPPLSPSSKTPPKASKEGSRPNSDQKLPPIKIKKKSYKRCSWCNKRTGLATSYNCRCNKNFCAAHRYAELHHCTFDYKTEGRRLLQQNNPVVKAPKLPKI